MIFSKNILKIGKAEILNGYVNSSGILHLYFSKKGNKVYTKTINLNNNLLIEASDNYVSATEIMPLTSEFKLIRTGTTIIEENG